MTLTRSVRSVGHGRHALRSVGSYEGRPHSTVTSCRTETASATAAAIFAVADVSGGKYRFSSRIFIRRALVACDSRSRDQKVAEDERVHLRAKKTIERLLWPAHDGLVVIKRSVEHYRHAGKFLECLN